MKVLRNSAVPKHENKRVLCAERPGLEQADGAYGHEDEARHSVDALHHNSDTSVSAGDVFGCE